MKRMIIAAVMACVMCSGAYAVSEDMSVYVRKDVFDAKMEMLLTRIEGKIDALSERIDGVEKSLSERIDGVEKSLSEKIDAVDKKLTARIDGLDKRIEDTHTFVYWILVLFGAIFLMPFVSRFWELHMERRTHAVTLDDVKRLITEAIAENNAKIRA